MRGWLLSLLLAAPAWAAPEAPRGGQMIDLSCMEALVAVGRAELAGVFSFVPAKDSPAAFADLLVHDPKALKRFAAKVEGDLKAFKGVAAWDHDALLFVLSIYSSPLAETLDKPGDKARKRLSELVAAPTLSVSEMTTLRSAR